MSVAFGSAPLRLRSHTRFARARLFLGERELYGKGCEAFDRGERTINDG